MQKAIKILTVFVCCIVVLFCFSGVYAADGEIQIQRGLDKKLGENKYSLYDNYTEFDGTIYEFNLDDYVANSAVETYEYNILNVSQNGLVEIDGSILRIVPQKTITDTIKINAIGSSGDVIELELVLGFVDASHYIFNKTLIPALIIVLLILMFVFLIYWYISFGKDTIHFKLVNSKKCEYINTTQTVRINRERGFLKIPEELNADYGFFFGAGGEKICFFPKTNVYKYDKNNKPKPVKDIITIENGGSVKLSDSTDPTDLGVVKIVFWSERN